MGRCCFLSVLFCILWVAVVGINSGALESVPAVGACVCDCLGGVEAVPVGGVGKLGLW